MNKKVTNLVCGILLIPALIGLSFFIPQVSNSMSFGMWMTFAILANFSLPLLPIIIGGLLINNSSGKIWKIIGVLSILLGIYGFTRLMIQIFRVNAGM